MSLNCNEINVILSELNLQDGFIQEIVQPSYDMLYFRIVKNGALKNIVICTGASVCRIHETEARGTKNAKPLRFYEFLKARVQGMRINECKQLGLERIIRLNLSTWQERLFMYIRLWSGAANVIVTDEGGTILDCMYRRPKKNECTGEPFFVEEKISTQEEKDEALKRFPVRDFASLRQWYSNVDSFSFNRKVDLFYTEHAQSLSRESLLAQAQKWYTARHSKMTLALSHLEQKKAQFEHADTLRHTGDLILTYGIAQFGSAPVHAPFLDCTDFENNREVRIRLDETKTAQENAALYYAQYKKALSGKEELEHDIERSKRAIQKLEAEYAALLKEENVIKLEQALRKDTTPAQKNEKSVPGLQYAVDGWTILVGRTAAENDDLLRHHVRGSDFWLHTRDFAGGYVFIKAQKNKTVPLDILLSAGNLAVYHSKARKNAQADLYYTQVKFLRRAKNGPKGLVLPTQEKNLFIKLDPARMRALKECEL